MVHCASFFFSSTLVESGDFDTNSLFCCFVVSISRGHCVSLVCAFVSSEENDGNCEKYSAFVLFCKQPHVIIV